VNLRSTNDGLSFLNLCTREEGACMHLTTTREEEKEEEEK
jgi:hypothetical protein